MGLARLTLVCHSCKATCCYIRDRGRVLITQYTEIIVSSSTADLRLFVQANGNRGHMFSSNLLDF